MSERIGIAVYCGTCGQRKAPVGRSIPVGAYLCDDYCAGYRQAPLPGSLWPGETSGEFGYPCGTDGTVEIAGGAQGDGNG